MPFCVLSGDEVGILSPIVMAVSMVYVNNKQGVVELL
jgi:hypothetical protein